MSDDDMSVYDESDASESDASDEEIDFAAEGTDAEQLVVCLSVRELTDNRHAREQQLVDMSGLPPDVAQILLLAHLWHLDRAISAFADNPDRALAEAGLSLAPPTPVDDEAECCVCMDSAEDGAVLLPPLACGHVGCETCWAAYLTSAITDRHEPLVTCLGSGCRMAVPRPFMAQLLPRSTMDTLEELLNQSFVDQQRNLKWCPTPECNMLIMADYGSVTCARCKEPFCFSCGDEHSPAYCRDVKQFEARCVKDGGSVAWLTTNAKECPNCSAFIEKNGGCNWIQCFKCKFEFCWVCLRHMKHNEVDAAGGNHRCNVFKKGEEEEIAQRNTERTQKSRADEMRKFAHYFQRYQNHRDSSRQELRNLKCFSQDPPGVVPRIVWDAQKQAVYQLRLGRRMLWNSYIFGFYKNWTAFASQKDIFEFLQHLLEARTEALSQTINQSLEAMKKGDNLESLRPTLQQHTDAVKVNMHNLVDLCNKELTEPDM